MDEKHIRDRQKLLELAVAELQAHTGLAIVHKEPPRVRGSHEYDARLQLGKGNFKAVVKRWAANTDFGALVQQLQAINGKPLLVADYINRNMGERLKKLELQYIDTAGNAYIDLPGKFVYIAGNKPPEIKTKPRDRAFTTQGLRVVYAILCDPELVGRPYRTIAKTAGVAVGTIGVVIKDLKAAGFLVELKRNDGRRLRRYRELLDRWTERYPVYLRQKQLLGEYIADDPEWWTTTKPKENEYWGGELAAEKYTNYLNPQMADIYLEPDQLNAFLRRIKGRRARVEEHDTPGFVTCYGTFWTGQDGNDGYVHPILAYADLVATAHPRNLEVADIIREKYIAQIFTDD